MRQMYIRRWSMMDVTAGGDKALVSWPVPKDCIVNSLSGETHAVFPIVLTRDAVSFSIEGWMLQTDDIATDFADQSAIWDTSVPKDDGSEVLDSSFGANAASMFEPGLINAAQMFDQELLTPSRLFKVTPLISLASGPFGFEPTTFTWHPTKIVNISLKGRYMSRFDGALVFGGGSPAWDVSENNDIITILGTHQKALYAMAHIDDVIDKAMIDFLVLIETGAESPYDDIMTWLMNLLETVQQDTSNGNFFPATIVFTTLAIAGIAVPGTIRGKTLGPDMQST